MYSTYIETTRSLPIKLPTRKKMDTVSSEMFTYSFHNYMLHTGSDAFHPNITNTPPNEFMEQLKNRMDKYFSDK